MFAIIHLLATFIADLSKPQRRLEVENLFLRHQLNVALRGAPHRPQLRGSDRALLVWMTGLWPSLAVRCLPANSNREGSSDDLRSTLGPQIEIPQRSSAVVCTENSI